MAADLQEPPELLVAFFRALAADECDVAIGTRNARNDPASSRLASSLFWGMYRKLVVPDMPPGGVDVFGCNTVFRDQLLALDESRSSLIALIFWLGFRRKLVGYERLVRQEGKSAWTLSKKIDYMMDSIFAFTDYPIRLLMRIGALGSAASLGVALMVAVARLVGAISVPGYAATMLAVLVLGALNLLGLGSWSVPTPGVPTKTASSGRWPWWRCGLPTGSGDAGRVRQRDRAGAPMIAAGRGTRRGDAAGRAARSPHSHLSYL
ncbi:hypothetical protein [Massilia sp. Se16.2.3]|uniref:hypothetical protein n=1 Tax=Massilia sp. Se16.2.3 TaxID=2709303 RepID=UPI001E309755|nr:hypothetical protein [Massilia sp. Se16.2.3]